jgi:aspartyl-tRNA(Asn)/glutamyl-tRNA(Gln) amidotransferase subunit B
MRNVKKAIEYEFQRQVDLMEKGERLDQETRGYDALKNITLTQRSKEHAHDYRYFPEPDLPPVVLKESYIADVRANMPKLPSQLIREYTTDFGLPAYDAKVITDDKDLAFYFNELLAETKNYKAASNWLLGPVKSYLNENALEITDLKISPKKLSSLIALIDEGKTNFSVASQRIFPEMLTHPDKEPLKIAEELNLLQNSDEGMLKELAEKVLSNFADKVAEYKAGKVGLMGLFVGEVMKASKGKADPKLTTKILNELLK